MVAAAAVGAEQNVGQDTGDLAESVTDPNERLCASGWGTKLQYHNSTGCTLIRPQLLLPAARMVRKYDQAVRRRISSNPNVPNASMVSAPGSGTELTYELIND